MKELIRLKEIAKYIIPYKRFADVGCDHGYMIVEAFKLSDFISCIAIDNKKGPLKSCINNLKDKNYFDKVRFSLSSGIENIDDDTEVVCIAGMGGINVVNILKSDLKNIKRIIICANRDNYEVRKHLTSINFNISNEEVVFENNKYYQIIVFDRGIKEIKLSEEELLYGPLLIKNKSNLFIQMLNEELDRIKNINSVKLNEKKDIIRRILNENR